MTTADHTLAGVSIDGPIATLTLRRAEQRNALSLELLDALHAGVGEVARTGGVRALVVTGEGKAFSAGMDLKQVLLDDESDRELPRRLLGSLGELTLRLRSLPMVVIASVNGAAVGGGCGMVCVADIAISHAGATLGFLEVDLGLCPAVITPWVVRKLGAGRARAALLKGGVMSASEAHAIGLIDHLADDRAHLDVLTREIAERVAQGTSAALASTKGLLNTLDAPIDARLLERGADLSAERLVSDEAQARLRARRR